MTPPNPLTAIIKGVDELWDVALVKFIFEMVSRSVNENITEMGARGMLDVDKKEYTVEVSYRIWELFRLVQNGELDPHELKTELDRWDLFPDRRPFFKPLP